MSVSRKHPSLSASTATAGSSAAKRRSVQTRTVEKWKLENDRQLNTSTWLCYEMADRDHVASLSCSVCVQFKEKLQSMRNYSPAFIEGSKNLRVSSFKDHAASDMHARAMLLLKRSHSSDIREYAPIAKSLHSMDSSSEQRMKRKFDIAYVIAKQNMAYSKMQPICELEERHGVDLGQGYKNNQACSTFIEYIALERRKILAAALSHAKFFSIQADGTTDSGNTEEELFLAVYLDYNASDKRVHVRNPFFTVRRVENADAQGLLQCLEQATVHVGVGMQWKKKLVGFGCDGANVNIANRGLKGYLHATAPWVHFLWCLSHRLELALKEALKNTNFPAVDEMLMRIYYLYKKSPKKCHELECIVEELKLCFTENEVPTSGGIRPIRACGTRFVSHKVAALERLIDRFGAYLNHLATLASDPHVKAVDREKMKGYISKWKDAQMILS